MMDPYHGKAYKTYKNRQDGNGKIRVTAETKPKQKWQPKKT